MLFQNPDDLLSVNRLFFIPNPPVPCTRDSQLRLVEVSGGTSGLYLAAHPDTTVDTLNVFEANLPDYDAKAIGAKYKGAADQSMDPAETALWTTITALAKRFQQADRIVLDVPMWNFAYLYKLKQLIDLACQRNLLFTFDGTSFGPKLSTPKALVIYAQGQSYAENSPTPASRYDHQTGFLDFWLDFIGVKEVLKLVVENTWSGQAEVSIGAGKREAARLARHF